MKRILSLLGAVTITATASTTATAFVKVKDTTENMNSIQKVAYYDDLYKNINIESLKRNKREKDKNFLPKLIKKTDLGIITTNSEKNILDQIVSLNRNIRIDQIAINNLVNGQAQIVLSEALENNALIENNFVWVTFETDSEVEIQVGNSIFYHNPPITESYNPIRHFSMDLTSGTQVKTFNLGIIPDNRGATILDQLKKQCNSFNFFNMILPMCKFNRMILSDITSSTAILSLDINSPNHSWTSENTALENRTEFLITFTPQRIDLNSVITITGLDTIDRTEVLGRITELYPQLGYVNILVDFVSRTVARIFVRDDNPVYIGEASISLGDNSNNVISRQSQPPIMVNDLFPNTELGELPDNLPQTIFKRLASLNNIDNINRYERFFINDITHNSAIISANSNSTRYSGSVIVSFTLNNEEVKTIKEKTNKKDDDSSDKDKTDEKSELIRKLDRISLSLNNLDLNWNITGPITDDTKSESKELNLIKWSDYATSVQEFKEKFKHIKFNDLDASAGGQGTTVSNKTSIEFNTEKIDDTETYKEIIKYYFCNWIPFPFINYVEQSASVYIKNFFFEGEYLKASLISNTYSWMAVYHVWTKLKIGSVEFY